MVYGGAGTLLRESLNGPRTGIRLTFTDQGPGILNIELAMRDGFTTGTGLGRRFKQVGINEYKPGAGIGWHRDKPQFGDVIGISLLSPAKMRLRQREAEKWLRRAIVVQRRSIYLLSGAARTPWEHSIPPVDALRYAIMFRTLVDEGTSGEPKEATGLPAENHILSTRASSKWVR